MKNKYNPKSWQKTQGLTEPNSNAYRPKKGKAIVRSKYQSIRHEHYPSCQLGWFRVLLILFYGFMIMLLLLGMPKLFPVPVPVPVFEDLSIQYIVKIVYGVLLLIAGIHLFFRIRSGIRESRFPDGPFWLSKKIFQYHLNNNSGIFLFILFVAVLCFLKQTDLRLSIFILISVYIVITKSLCELNLRYGIRSFLIRKDCLTNKSTSDLYSGLNLKRSLKRKAEIKSLIFQSCVYNARNGFPFVKPFYMNDPANPYRLDWNNFWYNMGSLQKKKKYFIRFCFGDLILEQLLWCFTLMLLIHIFLLVRFAFFMPV